MSVVYLELVDYLAIAAEVTGLAVEPLVKATKLDLADSALHAPAAGFGETEFYPDFIEKAAVLVVRLAKNHPLPDGNKRAAWVILRMFLAINGWEWRPARPPMRPNRPCSRSPQATGTKPRPQTGSGTTSPTPDRAKSPTDTANRANPQNTRPRTKAGERPNQSRDAQFATTGFRATS